MIKKEHLATLIESMVELEIKKNKPHIMKEYEDPLLKVFVQPMTDIVDTAKAGIEKLSTIAWTEIGSLSKQAAVLSLPFLSIGSIDEIQDKAQEKMEEKLKDIDSRYGDVLQRNYDMMRSRDLWGLTFLFNPEVLIGSRMAMKSPEIALQFLEAFTGGNKAVVNLRKKIEQINKFVLGGGSADSAISQASQYSGYDVGWYDGGGYGGFGEQIQPNRKKHTREQIPSAPSAPEANDINSRRKKAKQISGVIVNNFLKSKEGQEILKNSPVVNNLKSIAYESVMETANDIANLNTYDDFKNYFGEEFTKFEQELNKLIKQKPTPEQEAEFKEQLVPQMKKDLLNAYADQVLILANRYSGSSGAQLSNIAAKIKQMVR